MTTTEPTITAVITARAADSTVPDNDGAVDADIFVGETLLGEVTLLPDHTGELVTWGTLGHWAGVGVISHLVHDTEEEDRRAEIDAIVAAVRKAAALT